MFKRCVSISLLDFTLLSDTDEFYSCFHIREDKRHTIYTDKMEFHVLEFTKLPKELKEDSSDILLWAKFINAEQKEEFDMVAARNPYIQSAYEQLQIISQDKQKRLEYEAREKAIRDYNQSMYEAQRRGHKQGLRQGIQQGIQQGLEKGLQQKLVSQIQKKIEKNKTIEQIADDLDEPIEIVRTLYNELKKQK